MSGFPVTDGVTTFLAKPAEYDDYEIDFDNPQQRNVLDHYAIFGFLGSLALLCLAQRLYTKHFIAGRLQADDYLITLAWFMSLVMQSTQTWSISLGGLGHHAWEMPIEVFEKHMLSSYIAAPVFITCNGLSKTSLLTFYLRISPQKWFKVTIWATMALVIGYTTTIAGLLLFGCKPISASWDPYQMGLAECVDPAPLYMAIAVANIVSDAILFCIPIPTVLSLKMPLAQKAGASLMFGIGSITVATSIVRMAYLPSLLGATDVPWVAAPANVWSFVEVNLFIICGSMPTFRKFLKRFAPKFLGTWGSQPSKAPTYDLSANVMNRSRQQRTGYSQFDDVEMDRMSDKDVKDAHVRTTAIGAAVSSPTSSSQNLETGVVTRDDSSEEAILSAHESSSKNIAFSRTFQVQYEEK